MILLLLVAMVGGQSLLDFSIARWRKEPEMRIEDAYKWLYQATLGGEHAVADDGGPRAWLDAEWPTVGKPFRDEPEVVKLTPDGKLVRINLRPYKARGGDQEMMLAVFVRSAQSFHHPKGEFVAEWNGLGDRLKRQAIGRIDENKWAAFDRKMRKAGYPACDHSAQYEKARRPAYRVVLQTFWTR